MGDSWSGFQRGVCKLVVSKIKRHGHGDGIKQAWMCVFDGIKWKQLTPLPAFFLPRSFHQTRQLRVSMLSRGSLSSTLSLSAASPAIGRQWISRNAPPVRAAVRALQPAVVSCCYRRTRLLTDSWSVLPSFAYSHEPGVARRNTCGCGRHFYSLSVYF
jgi:hypothetical protein